MNSETKSVDKENESEDAVIVGLSVNENIVNGDVVLLAEDLMEKVASQPILCNRKSVYHNFK